MESGNFESVIQDALWAAHSLFERGKTSGSSANMSFKYGDKIYITAGGSCFGTLSAQDFSELSCDGVLLRGKKPSKELPLHLCYYSKSADIRAVIHTHSPYAVLWSCRRNLNSENVIPRFTPYLQMKVGKIGLVPYGKPGSPELFAAFESALSRGDAFLLKNHGGIVGGKNIMDAFFGIEELEESARIACFASFSADNFELIP